MNRTLAALFVLSALVLASSAAQEPAPPDWRSARATRNALWPWHDKETRRFNLPAAGLVQLFAETARVSVRYDQLALERLPTTTLTLGEGAEAPALFDLCQSALAPRFVILPEGGERRFSVCLPADIPSRAPTIAEVDLGTLADSEWAFCIFKLNGRLARVVERGLSALRSVSGRVEIVDDGRSLLVLDAGANLQRMRDLLPSLDRVRDNVPLVPYQRASVADVGKLVLNLRAFMKLFAGYSGVPEDRVNITWDEHSGVVAGMVPKELAASLDSAFEAAEALNDSRRATADAMDRRFVQFTLRAPASMEVVQFAARMGMLFQTEAGSGDTRFVPRDDKSATMFVRCRPWLEAEVKEAADLMAK